MERPTECGFPKIGMGKIVKELIRFKNFMDEIGEEFFLVGGTCLGIVRDGSLIEHDKDFDIGVLDEKSLYRIEEAENKSYNYYDEVHVVGVKNGKILWLKKYFDNKYVLPIEVAAQYTKNGHLFYNRHLRNWKFEKGHCVWDRNLFDLFEKIKFEGIELNVPNPVDKFLDSFYGKDWREPKKYTDWRYNCENLIPGWIE